MGASFPSRELLGDASRIAIGYSVMFSRTQLQVDGLEARVVIVTETQDWLMLMRYVEIRAS